MIQYLKTLLAVLLFPLLSSAAILQADVAGKWNVRLQLDAELGGNVMDSIWQIEQSGEEVSGSITELATGKVTEFSNGELTKSGRLEVKIETQFEGGPATIETSVKVGDGVFEGLYDVVVKDGLDDPDGYKDGVDTVRVWGKLFGKKADDSQHSTSSRKNKRSKPKRPKRRSTAKSQEEEYFAGQWDSLAVLPDGSESSGTMTLTRENGKLVGFLDGDNGKTEFKSIQEKKKTVLFAFEMNVQGVLRDLEIEAKVQKDGSLDGEWILIQDGVEAATGKWSATRNKEFQKTEVLFDGSSLENFRGYAKEEIGKGWSIQDGNLAFDGSGSGDIITKKEYANFALTFEWKISQGGNSGVMYRVGLGDNAPYFTGIEYQILDNDKHADGKNRSTSAAALYALYAPGDAVPKKVGQWNSSKIVVNGNEIEHWLNGEKVVEAELGSEAWQKKIAASKFASWNKFAKRKKGHIAFQDHGDRVWYRNIKIESLD